MEWMDGMFVIGHRSSKNTFLKGIKGLESAWIHVVLGILIHLIKWLIFVEFTELHWITCHFIMPPPLTPYRKELQEEDHHDAPQV